MYVYFYNEAIKLFYIIIYYKYCKVHFKNIFKIIREMNAFYSSNIMRHPI